MAASKSKRRHAAASGEQEDLPAVHVLRTNMEFSCDMPYDELDEFEPQPGSTVAEALGEILKALGCDVGVVADGGDHGWYLDFSYRSVRPTLEVTAIHGIVVQVHGPAPTRPRFGAHKPADPDYVEILMRLGEAIHADPRFHDLGWFNQEELTNCEVGASTPLGSYSNAPCVRYFGPADTISSVPERNHDALQAFEPAPDLLREGWTDLSPHPFRRWAARIFDMYVVAGAAFAAPVLLGLRRLGVTDDQLFVTVLPVRLAIGGLLSAFLISRTATTPGKWICGIRIVRKDGARITFGLALKRELEAVIAGCAMYLPLIGWIAMFYNREVLRITGETSWDRRRGLVAIHRPDSGWQALLIVIAAATAFYGWFALLDLTGALD